MWICIHLYAPISGHRHLRANFQGFRYEQGCSGHAFRSLWGNHVRVPWPLYREVIAAPWNSLFFLFSYGSSGLPTFFPSLSFLWSPAPQRPPEKPCLSSPCSLSKVVLCGSHQGLTSSECFSWHNFVCFVYQGFLKPPLGSNRPGMWNNPLALPCSHKQNL